MNPQNTELLPYLQGLIIITMKNTWLLQFSGEMDLQDSGTNNRYGFFPSGSVGWVASQEDFWPENDIVNFFKLRGGFGVVGNDNIGDFAFLSTVGGGRNYAFGTDGSFYNGVSPNAPSNPDLKWEETTQINIGFEATVVNDLRVTFDWFKKTTDDILMNPRIPGYVGAISNPAANVASMENTGVELELGYKKALSSEITFGINGNVSYLQNEVTDLGAGVDFLSGGNSFQASTYPITQNCSWSTYKFILWIPIPGSIPESG